VLEDAVRSGAGGNGLQRPQAAGADDEHLARLDVAHVGGADQVERAGLRADDPGVAEAAERQRAEAVRVAGGDEPVFVSITSENAPLSCAIDSTSASSTVAPCDRAYRCSTTSVSLLVWKIDPARTSSSRSSPRVHEVAVVARRDLAVRAVDEDRLGVLEPALAGRRIARVADGEVPRQRRSAASSKRRRRSPSRDTCASVAVGRGDAGALLPRCCSA
jgi:hypothetical protein